METKLRDSGIDRKKVSDLIRELYSSGPQRSLLQKAEDLYFEPKFFEKKGKIYELFGMKKFKKRLLALTSKIRRRANETDGSNYYVGSDLSVDSLKRFEAKTRFNEAVHMAGASPGVCGAIDGFVNGNYVSGLICTAIVLPQLYVIGLQRYNRARVYDLVDRIGFDYPL